MFVQPRIPASPGSCTTPRASETSQAPHETKLNRVKSAWTTSWRKLASSAVRYTLSGSSHVLIQTSDSLKSSRRSSSRLFVIHGCSESVKSGAELPVWTDGGGGRDQLSAPYLGYLTARLCLEGWVDDSCTKAKWIKVPDPRVCGSGTLICTFQESELCQYNFTGSFMLCDKLRERTPKERISTGFWLFCLFVSS